MEGYTKLYEMLDSALRQAGEESGMLLGQELVIALSDSLRTDKKSYFGCLEDACFVIGVESREAYAGTFYLVFSLRDAIVMSGCLLGIPPARIQEKKRLCILENDDVDAFGEIANMINGSFNTVFQSSLADKAHLKLLSPKKYIPEVDELSDSEPLPENNYLMFRAKVDMPGQEMNHLDVLIPVELGNLFDPPSEEPEQVESAAVVTEVPAEPDENVEAVAAEPARVSSAIPPAQRDEVKETGEDVVVVLDDDESERERLVTLFGSLGPRIVAGSLGSDIKELFSGCRVRAVMIGSVDADDRELAVCIKVHAMRQDSPPTIIMSAQRWTRTAVLKALKYGARDIIIKPCADDELVGKISRFVRAQQAPA